MNVGQLKEKLDGYGDHVTVVVVTGYGDGEEHEYTDLDVDDGMSFDLDETVVKILV